MMVGVMCSAIYAFGVAYLYILTDKDKITFFWWTVGNQAVGGIVSGCLHVSNPSIIASILPDETDKYMQ